MNAAYSQLEISRRIKSLDHSLMTQQNLKWRVNSNFLPTSFYFQHVWIISGWIKFLDKITVIPRISLTDHFLILTLLNTTLRQCLKDCNIFHTPCRLVRLRMLIFAPKKSNEIFLKFFFSRQEFFLIRILSLFPVVCLW